MSASSTSVTDNPAKTRYEVRVGDQLAGFAQYVRRAGRTYFVHTEIDPSFGGQGLGTVLVHGALDAERLAGTPIVPLCPFVHAYVERHPEYNEIVDAGVLASIDRGV